jgi:hypothetical protein
MRGWVRATGRESSHPTPQLPPSPREHGEYREQASDASHDRAGDQKVAHGALVTNL